MRIDRRLVLIGVMVIVLSMTMATQYATTKIGYSYSVVHPSDADIRFIGSDNSSDGVRVLRIDGDNSTATDRDITVRLGNITVDSNKTYTAAFGIVNEEPYNVTITHINVSASNGADYMQIWLHGDRDAIAGDDGTSVLVWNKATVGQSSTSSTWGLAAGDMNTSSMDGTDATTSWDDTAGVRYSTHDTNAANNTDDFVWVQISLDVPADADTSATFDGIIYVHTRATTHDA